MAISYPLALPTSIGIANITLSANNAVAISQSPFTFQQQIIQHPGQRWTASVSIPPVRRDLAEPWNAFLLALNGPVGTFLLGDPNAKAPRGTALGFRRNLLTYSEQFDSSNWFKLNATLTPNATVAPDGQTTADRFSNSEQAYIAQSQSYVSGTRYTFSCYGKADESNFMQLIVTSAAFGSNIIGVFDLVNGLSLLSGGGTNTSSSITDVGNGWFRCSISADAIATAAAQVQIRSADTFSVSLTYTGDGTSGMYIWGAQLEEGNLSDYQPIANAYGPYVNGAGQTGNSLVIDAGSPSETGYLLAGDYIQLGSGATATLHKVLQDVDTNEAGQATLDIWPNIRTAPADNALVTLTNTVGRFRLSGNQQSFSINEASIYGISFDCVEAL